MDEDASSVTRTKHVPENRRLSMRISERTNWCKEQTHRFPSYEAPVIIYSPPWPYFLRITNKLGRPRRSSHLHNTNPMPMSITYPTRTSSQLEEMKALGCEIQNVSTREGTRHIKSKKERRRRREEDRLTLAIISFSFNRSMSIADGCGGSICVFGLQLDLRCIPLLGNR